MTARKPKALGTTIEVPEGAIVRRPDDTEVTVTGGLYVLDTLGTHTIDGREQAVELGNPNPDATDSGHVD